MKHFFNRNGLWVLFAMAIVSVTLAVVSYYSATSNALENALHVLLTPVRTVSTAVTTWWDNTHHYYEINTALEEENQDLRTQLAQMEEQIRQAEADSAENQRLRELLNLRQQHRDLSFESATITQREVSNWTSSLTLNRGTDHDVAIGDFVITEEGHLVGIVDTVGLNWASVLTVVDTDTSLGVEVFRTKDLGLAQGDFQLMSQGRLRLNFLDSEATVLVGDLVTTSGLGNYNPTGIVVGTVESVQQDDSGATSYAILNPMVALDDLTQVFVITDFSIVD